MRHFFNKYVDGINTKNATEICRNHLSYIFYGVSLAGVSCRRVGQRPLLLPRQRYWARQAVGRKFSYYYP